MRQRGKYRFVSVHRPSTKANAGVAANNRGRALPTPPAVGTGLRTCASRRSTIHPSRRRASGLTAPGSTSPASTVAARGMRLEVVGTSGDGSCRRIHQRHPRHHRHRRRHRHRRINQWVTAHGRGVGRGGAVASDVYPAVVFAEAARFRCGARYNGVWRRCINCTSRTAIATGVERDGNGRRPPARGARAISSTALPRSVVAIHSSDGVAVLTVRAVDHPDGSWVR